MQVKTERVSMTLIGQQGNAFQRWQYFMSFMAFLFNFNSLMSKYKRSRAISRDDSTISCDYSYANKLDILRLTPQIKAFLRLCNLSVIHIQI